MSKHNAALLEKQETPSTSFDLYPFLTEDLPDCVEEPYSRKLPSPPQADALDPDIHRRQHENAAEARRRFGDPLVNALMGEDLGKGNVAQIENEISEIEKVVKILVESARLLNDHLENVKTSREEGERIKRRIAETKAEIDRSNAERELLERRRNSRGRTSRLPRSFK